jgi:hypothetical protein
MSHPATRVGSNPFWARSLALAAVLGGLSACNGPAPERILVATSWPASDRRQLEMEFQRWVAASHAHLDHRRVRLEWLIIGPRDDLSHLASGGSPPEVVLGTSPAAIDRLARASQLAPIDCASSSPWCFTRCTTNDAGDGFSNAHPAEPAGQGQRARGQPPLPPNDPAAPPFFLDDPRNDPVSLDWAMSQLEQGKWLNGYATLVRIAGHQGRIGHRASPGRAAVSAQTPVPAVDTGTAPIRGGGGDGVAILRSAHHQDLAQGFLRFLADTQGLVPALGRSSVHIGVNAEVAPIVADLLGATLVDAQDELWEAWASLERTGEAATALAWLTEPPPWPPASVAKYLRREGGRAMSLIESLAAELAPEPAIRAWLIRSWLAPERKVDLVLLTELVRAADGRLCREPRFRAWLRGEWTAWARQRYRRIAREAALGHTNASV